MYSIYSQFILDVFICNVIFQNRVDSSQLDLNIPRCRHNINQFAQESSQHNHMTDNFEEFTLDSLELEEDRSSHEMEDRIHGKVAELWSNIHRRGKENLMPSYEMRRCGDGAEMKVCV